MAVNSSSTSSSSATPVAARSGDWNWRRVWNALPVVRWTVAFLLLGESVAVIVAPAVVPNWVYLRLYLGDQSLENTREFLADSDSYLEWDALTGWRNRPGVHRDRWQVDMSGSRTTNAGRPAEKQVLFLGDSMTNGGTAVSNEETISAYVEDSHTASLNFATMLYGLDQAYLAFRHQLRSARPDVVVVGLSENAIVALGNRYVPLRRRDERNMPFFKPRFVLRNGTLVLIPAPPRQAYQDVVDRGCILEELSTTDDYYPAFAAFRRTAMTPIAGFVWRAWSRADAAWSSVVVTDSLWSPLLAAIMHAITNEAASRGASTVFLLHGSARDVFPSRWRTLLPDKFAHLLSRLRDSGFTVVDAASLLRESGQGPRALYGADRLHYSPLGNHVLASGLSRALRRASRQ